MLSVCPLLFFPFFVHGSRIPIFSSPVTPNPRLLSLKQILGKKLQSSGLPLEASLQKFTKEVGQRKMGERGEEDETRFNEWPAIKFKKDLQITRLKDIHLFTVHNLFTSAESRAFINVAESIGFVHQGSLGPTRGEAYRDNDRISVNDPLLAQTIWESGLKKLLSNIKIRGKVAVGLNPNIRFYRYKAGQRFGRHIDESVVLEDGNQTYYTLLIYLSGGGGLRSKSKNDSSSNQESNVESLVGGETVFYDSRRGVVAEVTPAEGMALLHIHGDKCMLHEARNVTKGIKISSGAGRSNFCSWCSQQTIVVKRSLVLNVNWCHLKIWIQLFTPYT